VVGAGAATERFSNNSEGVRAHAAIQELDLESAVDNRLRLKGSPYIFGADPPVRYRIRRRRCGRVCRYIRASVDHEGRK
jgi:hypothetical protein